MIQTVPIAISDRAKERSVPAPCPGVAARWWRRVQQAWRWTAWLLLVGATELAFGYGGHTGAAFPNSGFQIGFFGDRVNPGTTHDFLVTLNPNGSFGGFDLSATGGEFAAVIGQFTRLTVATDSGGVDAVGEITHLGPKREDFSAIIWGVRWTAPTDADDRRAARLSHGAYRPTQTLHRRRL